MAGLLALPSAFAAELTINNAWLKQPIPGSDNGAAYASLHNDSEQTVVITGVSSNAAERTEIHEHQMQQGMMKMVHLPELRIAPGETASFNPGGLHFMLFKLNPQLRVGEQVNFTLRFEDGSEQQFQARVKAI
ncbi:copper chaperone PCu(A)C [Idiomarina xiamenensis]|nr:copper chaperone PCu(A)C [Idiomarina xiamenensis]